MHYLVLAVESTGDSYGTMIIVQRTFSSDTELTKDELERMFYVAHWKEFAELSESESTDGWTDDDFQEFYEENDGIIDIDHIFQSNTPIHLEEVAK